MPADSPNDHSLQIDVETNGLVTVVSPHGRIDSAVSDLFLARLNEIIDGGCNKLVIDFSQLAFISSTGLRVLLACEKKMKPREGKIHICCLADNIKEIFDITAFSEIFPIFTTRSAALAELT